MKNRDADAVRTGEDGLVVWLMAARVCSGGALSRTAATF
jgi:hypothetical protein